MMTKDILVAEDNLVNQQVVAQMLSRLGHDVKVVDNGKKAVEAALTGTYDLVFMDLMMPVLDGLSATIEIRECERPALRVPIVALTARTESRDQRNCIDAGMDAFIPKPFTSQQLEECINRFLKPTYFTSESVVINHSILSTFLEAMGEYDEEFTRELIRDYLSEATRIRSDIYAGLASEDVELVCRAVHSLKASSAVIGAQYLSEICGKLEKSCLLDDLERVRLKLSLFDGALNQVRQELSSFQEQSFKNAS